MVTLLSVNALNLYGSADDLGEQHRYTALEDLIRRFDADVIAVQEIIADGTDRQSKTVTAVRGLHRLAEAIDRDCTVDRQPAIAVGGIIHHTGLLWRAGIEPVSDTLHTLTRDGAGMWHCAVSVVLDLGGTPIRVGSTHLSSFDMNWAVQDVAQLLRVFNTGTVPGLLGGDFNGIGSNSTYDPDPYIGVPWHPDHAYQLTDTGTVTRQSCIG